MTPHDPVPLEPRRVLLVEDEAMSRTLLAGVLVAAGFEVEVAEAADDAIDAFRAFDPDALVTDIDLGTGPTGLELVVSLAARNPHLPVVVLSNYAITPDYRHEVLSRAAYLRKKDLKDTDVLLDALEGVLRDRPTGPRPVGPSGGSLASLTTSQIHVLRMIAEGLSNQEIADRRRCSLRAAETMVHRTIAALGLEADPSVNTRVMAARMYIQEAGLPRQAVVADVAPVDMDG